MSLEREIIEGKLDIIDRNLRFLDEFKTLRPTPKGTNTTPSRPKIQIIHLMNLNLNRTPSLQDPLVPAFFPFITRL